MYCPNCYRGELYVAHSTTQIEFFDIELKSKKSISLIEDEEMAETNEDLVVYCTEGCELLNTDSFKDLKTFLKKVRKRNIRPFVIKDLIRVQD